MSVRIECIERYRDELVRPRTRTSADCLNARDMVSGSRWETRELTIELSISLDSLEMVKNRLRMIT